MIDCPCCSGKAYDHCCKTVLIGEPATTALALMRSRYSAYHNGQVDYLFNSTHIKTRKNYPISEIEKWVKQNTWTKLEIISTEYGSINDVRGVVEFKAHFLDQRNKNQVHHERSNFLKENERWYYLNGELDPSEIDLMKKVSRNDPCPCGSSKKYKKCCA